ncbi:MAG TPA: hypothetical protein VMV34_10280 [Terriglobia bacterium]|nr:hypothetical protein [Terriglobia bacterium]
MSETDLAQRIETLERDNRRLKRVLAVAGPALLVALGFLYAFPRSSARMRLRSAADVIHAREWDLVDSSGRVRLQASMDCALPTGCSPQIRLFDQDGKALTTLGAGALSFSGKTGEARLSAGSLHFSSSPEGGIAGAMAQIGITPGSGGHLSLVGKGLSHFFVNSDLPRVEMGDSQGYMMELGASDLTTVNSGQTRQTTAASIVMYANDKQHHVIWQMP